MNRPARTFLFLSGLLAAAPAPQARGAVFYVDPQRGSADGDGSRQHPWRTLQEVIEAGLIRTRTWADLPPGPNTPLVEVNPDAPIGPGDTIRLRSGYHGEVEILGWYNERPITIEADSGHEPHVARIHMAGGAGWVFRGLTISPSFGNLPGQGTMVLLETSDFRGPVSDVVLDGCTLYTVPDAGSWDATDWDSLSWSGIRSSGERMTFSNNVLENVDFGITVSGPNALVSHNRIVGFAGDGLRGLGDYGVFEYNIVQNSYDVNENHDDGFQSWSVGPEGVGSGQVVGVVLRGNVIINYTDPHQPHRGHLQGIGCFDGLYVQWVVENNVVIVDHYHGISLYGAIDCKVVNNTVWDPDVTNEVGPTWIRIADHKDGIPSSGTVVRNNLAPVFAGMEAPGVIFDHNLEVSDPGVFFVDAAGYDFHLLPDSPAVDTGSPDLAPEVDIEGVPRPQGSGVDLGAYEYHEGPVASSDGGVASGDAGLRPEGGTGDASTGSSPPESGCGCGVTLAPGPRWLWDLVVCLVTLLRWRRRRLGFTARRVRSRARSAPGGIRPPSARAPDPGGP